MTAFTVSHLIKSRIMNIFVIILFAVGLLLEFLNVHSRSTEKETPDTVSGLPVVPVVFYMMGIYFYKAELTPKLIAFALGVALHLICYFIIPKIFRKKSN